MKKVTLSVLTAAILTSSLAAETDNTITLYTDVKTGQVFTTPGEGRVEMGDFIDAKTVDQHERDQSSQLAEYQDKMKKYTNVSSHAKQLQFSGTHYFGFTSARPSSKTVDNGNSSGFESRRNYVQVKAYFNDKDFFRVTLDGIKELNTPSNNQGDSLTQERDTSAQNNGFSTVFFKYAYLWLDEVLPYTGVEIGMAHRPWIDYEEHNSWYYRSWSKVALENRTSSVRSGVPNSLSEHGPDLVNSADMGVNFRTKTDYFTSEIGVFNGEGYHADKIAANQSNSGELSLEWRLTADLLGTGGKQGKYDLRKDTYAHVSTYGLLSRNHKDNNLTIDDSLEYDRQIFGLHAVYNQPEFLISGQVYTAYDDLQVRNTSGKDIKYHGWSINGEYRPLEDWTVIGRYDAFKKTETVNNSGAETVLNNAHTWMYGLAYEYNHNVKFIGSAKMIKENADQTAAIRANRDATTKDVYMLTTEIEW